MPITSQPDLSTFRSRDREKYMYSAGIRSTQKGIPGLIRIFFLVDAGLCVLYLISKTVEQPIDVLTRLLDLDSESSLAAWYSSTQLFCVFIASAIFTLHKRAQGSASLFPLAILPVMFLSMSVDESVQIHEWVGRQSDFFLANGSRAGTTFAASGIWMFVFGIPFLIFFLLCARSMKAAFHEKPNAFRKLVIGMIIMLTGALGFETFSNFVESDYLVVEILFEEGLEMAGVTVMLWAMYDMAVDHVSVQVRRAPDGPSASVS